VSARAAASHERSQPEAPGLRGRRILVTGASRGIGREIAVLLAEQGASVVLVARGRVQLERCAAQLPDGRHRALALDVGDSRAWTAAGQVGALEGVTGLVTAAAVLAPVGSIGDYSMDELWQSMRVNVLGTLLAVEACLGSLKAGKGAVVAFAGAGATSAHPRYDAYAASKAAVARLSENLALDLLEHSVRVNAVSPGFVATTIHEATLRAGPRAAGEASFAATRRQLERGAVPARRAAELTAFLLGDAARGITGRLISAQWDPWREPAFQQRLREEPDLARLRRIDDRLFAPCRPPSRR